jgi:hypothetical protein
MIAAQRTGVQKNMKRFPPACLAAPACLALLAAIASAQPGAAADPFYLGTWKIDSAIVGPWVETPFANDTAEMKTLVGKTIAIAAKGIKAPNTLACTDPHYQVTDTGADMLFEGGLEEVKLNGGSATAQELAEKLGFKGTSWKTLDPGCENEIQYHFLDDHTAEFALDNYVYVLKKQ